jgi:hypothetical protein
VASTAESLTAQAPSPGMVPAAEASAAGSLASLATQVRRQECKAKCQSFLQLLVRVLQS